MGRVRNRLVKRSARTIVEKHYDFLGHDFQTNKQVVGSVADIAGKRLRNQIAGVECGPVRGISLRIHEKERNIPDRIDPKDSILFGYRNNLSLDSDSHEMLKKLNLPIVGKPSRDK